MRFTTPIMILLTTGILSLAYGSQNRWIMVGLLVLTGLGWTAGQRLRRGGMAAFGLVSFVGAAAFGAVSGLAPLAMLAATVGALVAWDLDLFVRRLTRTARVDDPQGLWRKHLRHVLPVAAAGLLLGGLGLLARVSLSFGWALLLGALAVWGITEMITFIRRANE